MDISIADSKRAGPVYLESDFFFTSSRHLEIVAHFEKSIYMDVYSLFDA